MHKQHGIALITILMLVALATILAAGIAKQQTATADATQSLLHQNQALLYAKSAEAFFSEILIDDAKNAGQVDHLQETWAQQMPSFPVEGGVVSGRLEDQNAKFNLNALVQSDGNTVNLAAQAWFGRMLTRLNLSPELAEAVIDWQDQNDEVSGTMGAESQYYQSLGQSYVAPNQAFNQVESLKQIRGFEGQNYVLLKPYIAVYSREQKVNVNTASAWLLTSLDPKLKLSDVENVLTQRRGQLKHWENLTDFWQTPPFDQVDATIQTQMNSLLGVQSNQFLSVVDIEFSGYTRYMQSQLKRQGQNIQVQSRALIPFDQ